MPPSPQVPTALSDSILQYYAYLWGSSSSYTGLWDDLSPSLRTSLNAAVMNRCLSKCPLFEDLSSAFLVSLSNLLADNSITLIPDEILFDEGDEGTAMFFVRHHHPPPSQSRRRSRSRHRCYYCSYCSQPSISHNVANMQVNRGEISIFKVLNDHSHLSVAKIPPGGFFGEVAIVNETVRSAGSQATVFSELYILEKELLTDLLVDFPEFESTIKSHIEELRLLHVRRDTAKVAPSADQIKMLQDYAADQVGSLLKRPRTGPFSYVKTSVHHKTCPLRRFCYTPPSSIAGEEKK